MLGPTTSKHVPGVQAGSFQIKQLTLAVKYAHLVPMLLLDQGRVILVQQASMIMTVLLPQRAYRVQLAPSQTVKRLHSVQCAQQVRILT